jgi:hypothetical protein
LEARHHVGNDRVGWILEKYIENRYNKEMNSRVMFQKVYRRLKGLYRQQNQTLAEEPLAMKGG